MLDQGPLDPLLEGERRLVSQDAARLFDRVVEVQAEELVAGLVDQRRILGAAELRNAFPSVEQIDRRMRDLRAEGWVIATYREDRSMSQDELRLVAMGGRVWEEAYHSRSGATTWRSWAGARPRRHAGPWPSSP